jgi:hypothetical protein
MSSRAVAFPPPPASDPQVGEGKIAAHPARVDALVSDGDLGGMRDGLEARDPHAFALNPVTRCPRACAEAPPPRRIFPSEHPG